MVTMGIFGFPFFLSEYQQSMLRIVIDAAQLSRIPDTAVECHDCGHNVDAFQFVLMGELSSPPLIF